MTREVIFTKIQYPTKLKHKMIYLFESLIGLITRVSAHTYKCLVDMKIAEESDSSGYSQVLSLVVWECVDCHMKEMWICKEEKIVEQ